jgi:hypothetical protein
MAYTPKDQDVLKYFRDLGIDFRISMAGRHLVNTLQIDLPTISRNEVERVVQRVVSEYNCYCADTIVLSLEEKD